MLKITEDNYIKLMQCKNEKALWYFIEHYGWIVKSIVKNKLAAYNDEQEECINDIFLAVWENVGKYDESKASFTTWLAAVSRYRILNFMRKQQRHKTAVNIDDFELMGETDINPSVYRYDEEREFRELLGCLSEQDQEIFMKLFWEELSHEEISESTGLNRDVLYNRISRGKKKLKLKLMYRNEDN